ncbi:chitooligosaccharide deacetylase NodB [Mesorhizobium carmichaelinearum]|uniref:chitooligosaccharide deacetylase NodB n=1 Tax=Mesorhizobium carmichaelinearum TaxID=1208188 RepID=UPI000BA45791|nr:chitooligosaccharide deacetylase NodB [Mesorhizobium carmichaelinearum]
MKQLDHICEMRTRSPGGAEDRSVYLTFDDGPNRFYTPDILTVLAEYRVPATFFVLGTYATNQPELIRRMVAEGHEVANHTMTHPDLSTCEPEEIERQIIEANGAIRAACPQAVPRLVRAPYGLWNEDVLSISARAGLTSVHWSVDPMDWSRPGVSAIVEAVLASIQPGAIILLHDGCPPDEVARCTISASRDQTLMALPHIISGLRDRRFVFRSLP